MAFHEVTEPWVFTTASIIQQENARVRMRSGNQPCLLFYVIFCVWLSRSGRTVCKWLIEVLLQISLSWAHPCWMNLTVSLCFKGEIASIALSWTHTASSFPLCVCSRLERYNTAPIFSFSEAFNLRSGISLASPQSSHRFYNSSNRGTSVSSRSDREEVCFPAVHSLSILEPWEKKMKRIYLGFSSSLNPSCVLPSAFICRTHTYTNPRNGAPMQRRRYSEGPWMDGWHLHALIECMFAQYFSAADGFIRHIDLEGR